MKYILTSLYCGVLLVATPATRAQTVEEATAQAQLEKAVAEAMKAKYDAESSATKAKFGALADYESSGTTAAGASAGALEASLLGVDATRSVGVDIGKEVCESLKQAAAPKSPVYVVAESHVISFESYDAFLIQAQAINEQMSAALVMSPTSTSSGADLTASASSPGTAVAILGNLFRTDYSVSNISLTADDQLLMRAVIDEAECRNEYAFRLPGQYIAPSRLADNDAMNSMRKLETLRRQLERKLLTDTATRANGMAAAQAEKDKAKATNLRVAAERFDLPIDAVTKALDAHAAFRNFLSTPNDKGILPLSLVVRQADLAKPLADGGYLLVLKANALGGTSYTRKDFWTFFGTMPFSVTGGTAASYTLIDGKSSNVLGTGVAARAVPYMKVHRAVARYKDGIPASPPK